MGLYKFETIFRWAYTWREGGVHIWGLIRGRRQPVLIVNYNDENKNEQHVFR